MEKAASDNKGNKGLLYLTVFLVITNLATLFLWYSQMQENKELITNNTDLSTERDELTFELEEMLAQYDSVNTDNAEMQAQIAEQRAEIERLLEEAKKHKDDAYIIYKLRKEANQLREIMKDYLVTIDSLNTLNQSLVEQKMEVQKQLSNQQSANKELNEENEALAKKVEIGSKLKAVNLVSIGQRVKNGTMSRETDRAKRVDKIKTCFTIDKNEVTKPGKKTLFLRIVSPNGKVMAFDQTEEYMFEYEGKEGLYSRKEEIEYKNEAFDLCLYWDVINEAQAGKYIVEVYAEDYLMGSTSFSLK